MPTGLFMINPDFVFDLLLIGLLIGLALAALHAPRLINGVVSFIVFGLLLALTWARLGAVDLALAEGALGAGLVGVMLFAALARSSKESPSVRRPRLYLLVLLMSLVLSALLLVLLAQTILPLAELSPVLPQRVSAELDNSGVSHTVTAVLLNFRAWDTLLELLVLLLALLGVRQLNLPMVSPAPAWPLLVAWSRLLAPLSVLVGGYLLWNGSHAPGGAFQAGALLAAALVMLRLSGLLPRLDWRLWPLRALVLIGLALFTGVAAVGAWLGEGWLVYAQGWQGELILLIEIAATLSIAASLTLLVVGENRELSS